MTAVGQRRDEREHALQAIRPQALYLFLYRPTAAQRTYIANLMTTAFMVASFTLDPRAAGRVQQLTAGQVVYLDTNVVYDALNLNGPRRFLSTKRILELTDPELGLPARSDSMGSRGDEGESPP
jgi:hypothetical protein